MKKTTVRLVLMAFAVSLLAQGMAAAQQSPTLTEAMRATEDDLVPTRTYSAPFLLVDPADDRTVVAGYVEMRSRVCGLLRSTDGGQTWIRPDALPAPPAYPFCFHTSGGVTQTPMAFGSNSTLYYAMAGWDEEDGGSRANISVLLARSDDLGDSWSRTVVRDTRGMEETENNRPVSAIAVDTSGAQDVVYVAWRSSGAFPMNLPMVAVSTDGGATFSEPISAIAGYFDDPSVMPDDIAEDQRVPENFGGNNPTMTVAGDGTVFVLWERLISADAETTAERASFVSRSSDRGATWDVFPAAPEMPNLGGSILRWSPLGGAQGTLHLIYHGKPGQTQGDSDIYYQRSTDAGQTWSEPRLMNDDEPEAMRAQFHPNLVVAPDGRLEAAWWDFRDDPGTFVNDIYHAVSTDNGATWSANQAITDQSVDRTIGPWSNNFDMRQPVGMAATRYYTLFGWDDTRHGDEVGQAQDIYVAALQYEALPSAFPRVLSYVLAAVIGLILVAVLLVIATFLARSIGGGPKPPRTKTAERPKEQPTPVGKQ
jgi:hypothetical protein